MSQSSRLQRIDQLSKALDSKFEIAGVRVGYDAIVGLIPGIGDLITTSLSLYIITEARQLGASWAVIARMLLNVLVEAVVGAIPLFGDVFDVFWRSNLRNLDLVKQLAAEPRRTEIKSGLIVWLLIAISVAIIVGLVALPIYLLTLLFNNVPA